MMFNPRVRNFKIRETEKNECGSRMESRQKDRLNNITQIVCSVIERMNQTDSLFRTDGFRNRKFARNEPLTISSCKGILGRQFEDSFVERMDPRDKVMSAPFHFSIPSPSEGFSQESDFLSSELFSAVSTHIEDYLVRMLEVVVSVSFNQLMEGKLKESECKDYASKNILLNVHAVCRETFRTLKERNLIDGKEKEVQIALIELVDNTLTNSVKLLAPYYPQAPPTGGTPRIRQALLAIDRNQNSDLDFLTTQKLFLERSIDGDYTEYIMRVINRAILVTGQMQEGQKTLFEQFKDFMENLIWLAKDESCIKAMSTIVNKDNKKAGKTKEPSTIQREQSQGEYQQTEESLSIPKRKELINAFFRQTTIPNAIEAVRIEGEKDPQITEESREKQLNSMKLNHEVEMGQKLPSGLETFGKNDLKDRNFTAKHSSVLRVITKWAQNLEAIFENAEKFILNRNYPFTTIAGRSVYPTANIKKKIFDQIIALKEQKNKIHDQLIAKNKWFQAQFLTKNGVNAQTTARFIKRYTDTRMVASKMNTLIIRFMQEYLSGLINLLIEAGRFEQNKNEQLGNGETEYINLISFRIGDLMRARMHVNEAACIRVLHTLYLLEEYENKDAPFFKLVRVKNKLDKQDNNVLINFLFKGKLQCELQLSSQKIEGKEQKYYAFSHFLYELSRGSFGILSQCAIIVSQHDPIVASHCLFEAKMTERKNVVATSDTILNDNKKEIFICGKCNRLIMNESKQIFLKQGDTEGICNQCFINHFGKCNQTLQIEERTKDSAHSKLIQRYLTNPDFAKQMIQMIENMQIRRLNHYGELAGIKQTCLFISINERYNKIDYNLLIYEETDTDWYLIRINDQNIHLTNDISKKEFEIKKITAKMKEQTTLKSLTYIETSLNRINMADIIIAYKKIKASNLDLVNRLFQIEDNVRNTIAKRNIEAILKNKNETIDLNKNKMKMEVMSDLAEAINNISHIEYVFAQKLELNAIPAWISKTKKLKLISLQDNKLSDVRSIQGKIQLKELYLARNQISEINCSNFRSLEKLDLSSNLLTQFVSQNLPSLLELNLSKNKIQLIDINYPILKVFNLSHNHVKQLDTTRLPSTLQKLVMSGNGLNQLPALPPNLKQLIIASNYISHLDQLKLPKSLIVLNVSSNRFADIKIEDMPNLVILIASSSLWFKTILMKNTPQLKQLSLQKTKIKSIEDIEFPEEMKSLILSQSQIKQVRLRNIKSIDTLIIKGNILKCLELNGANVKVLLLQRNKLDSLDNIIIPKYVQHLNLYSNELKSVILKDYPSLKIIQLHYNKLSSIDIDGMPSLVQLNLNNNCFDNFDGVRLSSSLQKLLLCSNKLTHLNLTDLSQLKCCTLDYNPLISVSLRNMPKLQEVSLRHCKINSQTDIDIPNTVRKIYLEYNKMNEIQYSNMPNLTTVDNKSNGLKSVKFENVKNLISIDLVDNKIIQLSIKNLKKLEHLSVNDNQLSELTLAGMPFLRTVRAEKNQLTQIRLEQVTLIQWLNVSQNKLKELKLKDLPMINSISANKNKIEVCQLQNMPSLKQISLDRNQIRAIKLIKLKSLIKLSLTKGIFESIHFSQLKNLEKLEIGGIKFTKWRVQGFPNLKQLSVTQSQLESLHFVEMVLLQKLQLNRNKLIEANFNDLPNLRKMLASYNSFTQLEINNLKQLEDLRVKSNYQLKSVSLTSFPKLTIIDLSENKIENLTLKGITVLKKLQLSSNKLKYIDTSDCKTLLGLNMTSNPIESMDCLNIYKPEIRHLILDSTLLETILIKQECFNRLQANSCKRLKQIRVENCNYMQHLMIRQNDSLKTVSVKENPRLSLIYMQFTSPNKCEIMNVPEDVRIFASSQKILKFIKRQNPLQQMQLIQQ